MFTVSYKGWYIHGYFGDNLVKVQSPDNVIRVFKSMRAAKRFISSAR